MTSKIEFNKDSMNNMHLTYTCKYLTISFLHFSNRIYEPQLPEGNIHGTNSKTTRNHSMLIYFSNFLKKSMESYSSAANSVLSHNGT